MAVHGFMLTHTIWCTGTQISLKWQNCYNCSHILQCHLLPLFSVVIMFFALPLRAYHLGTITATRRQTGTPKQRTIGSGACVRIVWSWSQYSSASSYLSFTLVVVRVWFFMDSFAILAMFMLIAPFCQTFCAPPLPSPPAYSVLATIQSGASERH